MGQLVTDAISGWARYAPQQPAIVYNGTDVVTFREIHEWTDNAAHELARLGVQQGDRVGVVGGNSLEWVAAAIGALKLGAIVVPMNERFVADELGHLADVAGTSVVLADAARTDVAQQMAAAKGLAVHPLESFAALRGQEHRPFRTPPLDSVKAAILIFTSGTSALPKAAIYTHDGLLRVVYENALVNPVLKQGTRWMYVLGMSGAPGLPWHVLHALNRGATLYYEKGFDPAKALARLVDEKIEMMVGVPMLFEMMMAQPAFETADLSSLQFSTIAGARCAPQVLSAWLQKGVALRQAYGMTEVTGTYTVNSAEDAFEHPDYCGRGSALSEHRVIRPDGTDCEPEEPGEIIVRSPMLVPGYWHNEEATREAFRDGWFHTGDVGVLDATGSVRIVDRLKDLIISGGYNIAPAEIENVISAVDGVQEVCVIATAHPKFGETPTAIVHGDGSLGEDQIRAVVEERLARYKRPTSYRIVSEPLPRMASGKIARRKVRDIYA
ncbi:class I adenylate-forming enzyme family protein [Cumulibacter manganitolerans]|uniref:class I adenylate-forming enzyme family protein n=1 Tax=Cumulibacter manganitolerans TaxID=1884992 RepID=UPI0012952693|nr:AMP-binding protein [Cumulibacter manganitolerans]